MNIVHADSVVIVTRVGLGKVAVLREPMCFSQDNQALLPKYKGLMNTQFLYYVACHEMQTLKLSGRGTTISGITKKQLEDVVILLPPLGEQVRIVQVIEIAYEQLNGISESLS